MTTIIISTIIVIAIIILLLLAFARIVATMSYCAPRWERKDIEKNSPNSKHHRKDKVQ